MVGYIGLSFSFTDSKYSSLQLFAVTERLFIVFCFFFRFCLLVLPGVNPGWKDEPLEVLLFYLKNL